ncbi:uncharacterized protein HGUI_01569 [Hanseniaspora guilliermondii]|uniref:CNH domain-containing protein n=1 Tax=Hanseniaspora guilliermondii TaxID=56406 RepID=A0A1L0CLR1_9ASCO|nr:uncharacterized protein HGUI_01569 [Hanseniaspora guilliermondii]
MENAEIDIHSLKVINDVVPELQTKHISLYKNEHIFLVGEESNDIFHYIKDGSSYILLFKHDYEDYKTSDDESVKIKKIESIDNANTMVILLDNGDLKSFVLPDLIYVDGSDVKNVDDFEYIGNNRVLIIKNGELKMYEIVNSKIIEQKWLTLKDIHEMSISTKIDKNKYGILLVDDKKKLKYLTVVIGKDNKFELKDVNTNKRDGNIKVYNIASALLYVIVVDNGQSSWIYFIAHGEMEVKKELEFSHEFMTLNVIDLNAFIEFKDYRIKLNLLTFKWEELQSLPNNFLSFDNKLVLSWKDVEELDKEGKYLQDFENRYKKVNIYENILLNQLAKDVQIEHEKLLLVNNLSIETNQAIIDESMQLLIPERTSSLIKNFDIESIQLCDLVYNLLRNAPKNVIINLEMQYVCYYKLLLITFHNESINNDIVESWVDMAIKDKIDLKVLFYLLGFEVFGDIWIYNGLINIVDKLKLLKLESKIDNRIQLLKDLIVLLTNDDTKSKIYDFYHVKKTINFEFVKAISKINDFNEVLELMNYVDHESFADELIKAYESINSEYILYALYKYKHNYRSCSLLLKDNEQFEDFEHELVDNLEEIKDDEEFISCFVVLCNNLTHLDSKLLKKATQLIAKEDKYAKLIIPKINNDLIKNELIAKLENLNNCDDELLDIILDFYSNKINKYFLNDPVVFAKYSKALQRYKEDNDIEGKSTLRDYLSDVIKSDNLGKSLINEVLSKLSHNLLVFENKLNERFQDHMYIKLLFGFDGGIDYNLEMNDFIMLTKEIHHDNDLLIRVLDNYKENELVFMKLLNKFILEATQSVEIFEIIPNNMKVKLMKGILLNTIVQMENKTDSLKTRIKLLSGL